MAYEFTEGQNAVIGKTASRTRIWGTLTLMGGVITLLIGLLAALTSSQSFGAIAGIVYLLLAAIPIYLGVQFRNAGSALKSVVQTEGSDIEHLMVALGSLSQAFLVQLVAAAAWAGLLIVGIVAAIALPAFLR